MKYGINLGISENILHRSNHLQKFFFFKDPIYLFMSF